MYYALYRKYRPKDLNEIVGQNIIKNSLINSLKNNKISHAYLFSGPRGTGKTSIAKILSRTVNCLNIKDGISCGKCNNCLDSLNGSSPDIIEIDAASNNGVDEIREIRNKVNLVPTSMKYKVYIIDEVHMLTTGAFNALLKTLEEPPSHVIFILATTDLHKVPITILSRCQTYNFKRISTDNITSHLNFICNQEKINIDFGILSKIADYSDGCMRDSIGLLEKLISYKSDDVSQVDLEDVLGTVNNNIIKLLINNIINLKTLECIELIDKVYKDGKEINFFVQDIISYLRDELVNYYKGTNIDYSIENLILLIKKFVEINNLLKNSSSVKTTLEIGVVDFINDFSKVNLDTKKHQIKEEKTNLEEKQIISREIKSNVSIDKKEDIMLFLKSENNASININKYNECKNDLVNNSFATANKELLRELKEKFRTINNSIFDINKSVIINIFLDSELVVAGENDLVFKVSYDSLIDSVTRYYWNIYDLIFEYLNKKYNFVFINAEDWNNYKNDFINNKNEGIKYQYKEIYIKREVEEKQIEKIEEKKVGLNDKNDNIVDLFGEVIEFE